MSIPLHAPSPPTALSGYETDFADEVLTPALLIYAGKVRSNIRAVIQMANGDPGRWRPHVKTAKLAWVMRLLVEHGVTAFKCATTKELRVACEAGARDVLVAFPHTGANAARIAALALEWPDVRISTLVEAESQLREWTRSSVSVFIDVNPGMDRTGVAQEDTERIGRLAAAVRKSGIVFRGLHYYDGQITSEDLEQRAREAYRGYDQLLRAAELLERSGTGVEEIITAGTPAFPCALRYPGFENGKFRHRVSPGTVVYCDTVSQKQLPADSGFAYAALVLARVVSHPRENVVTCDAGHKAVSADAGVPTCEVLGRPDLTPLRPSEEHLPISVASGSAVPEIGSYLYLVPRHVCPSVNLFDSALLVEDGKLIGVEPVSARGREDANVTLFSSRAT